MDGGLTVFGALPAFAILAAAALLCAALIVILRPWLTRYAMARPNPRSSHKLPTPQGGGIAVVAAAVAVTAAAITAMPAAAGGIRLPVIAGAVILIALVGVVADIHPQNVGPRLALQTLAIIAVIFALPADLRAIPFLPWWIERVALVIGGLWFVNLVNFMDGLDWMTVAETVPATAALAAIGLMRDLPSQEIIVSLALCGAMIGFAWFNRPIAVLFLGDVGSLPIGLALGWLLLLLAGSGGRAAAVLLPLYYLADATITLIRRMLRGEPIWQAHRSHFYQRATDRGFTVMQIVARVFAINVVLAALALITVILPSRAVDIAALGAGGVLVAWLLAAFTRGRS